MADRITNIISKVANTKVSDSDYTGSIKQELAKSIDSRFDTQIQNTKDKIASEKNGDKDNKIIEEKAKKYGFLLVKGEEIPLTKKELFDGLHPDNAGHMLIAERLIKELSE